MESLFPWISRLRRSRVMPWLFLGLLFVGGLCHWGYVFQFAKFRAYDWPMVADYQAVLRQALASHQIPYVMTAPKHGVGWFLGLPEVAFSPQCLLLPLLGDGTFNLVNILLLYAVGFAGLLVVRREYGLSYLAFLFLFLVFNFNGYLVSRVAVGHTMWYGYFFLPYFHVLVLRMQEQPALARWPVLTALALLAMELQGSFHLFIWCMMFMALIALCDPRLIRPFAVAALIGVLLCLFRLLPAVVAWWGQALPFMGGYPSIGDLLDAFTAIRPCTYYTQSMMGWWEFDCFVGLTGLCLLIYFGIIRRWQTEPAETVRRFDLANALMVALTFGSVYVAIHSLPIPLIASQRAPSRFIVLPLTMYMILATIQMQRYLASSPSPRGKALFCAALFFLAGELINHSATWRICDVELSYRTPPGMASAAGLSAIAPPAWDAPGFGLYVCAVWFSLAVSLITALVLLVIFLRKPAWRFRAP